MDRKRSDPTGTGWLVKIMAALMRRGSRTDGSPDRRFFLVAFGVAYVFFVCTYLPINLYSVGRPAHTLFLPGERALPFIPEFEFIYVLGYAIPVVAALAMPDSRRFAQLVTGFVLTLAVAYTTYLLFPVYLERPDLVPDSLATRMLSLEYEDPSYNHFPSLHVAISVLSYLSCRRGLRRRWPLLVLVLGVSVSTVFIKQHYIADLVYGAAVAVVAWTIAGRWVGRALAAESPDSSRETRPRLDDLPAARSGA
jgi:membrane-associated phospholipid phosphatase